jgi:N-acetylneuraminate lyase
MKEILRIEGLVAAPFAPMDNHGNIDLSIVPDYYRFLVKNGVKGVFINGTTGEGASLTQSEKKVVVEAWTTFGKTKNSMHIITLVGGTSYQECIENAVHAERSGVSAIAVIAPYFFKPPDVDQLAGFFIRIAKAVPGLPVFFYHMPSITGVNFPMAGFINKVDEELPNFAGIKFTHEDFMDFLTCLNFGERKYNILWGRDECMLSALTLGTVGFVGSTYNYAAPLYLKLIDAFRQNDLDEAQKLQQKSINMISLLGKYGGIATGKAFMKYVGIDCGEFRSPVKNMTADMYEAFVKDVRSLEMDGLFSKV